MTTLPLTMVALLALSAWGFAVTGTPEPPNVILIMTDDQGYGDLGCHGNPVLKTPHLDRLHGDSVRLTDFHVSPFCTPTRAALMTGRYPARTGAYRTSSGRTMMHPDERTIANSFANAGYVTGMIGKWHLGDNAPHRPQDRGFQEVLWHRCGGIGQASDYYGNDYFDDTYERNGVYEEFEGYCTDVWFSEAQRFVEANRSNPFFLYLAPNAPHGPYRVPEAWAAPYRDQVSWGGGAEFYGMVANIDHNVGLLREQLETLGLAENTIFIFMTDNGTANGAKFEGLTSEAVAGFNAGMRGKKSSVYEGGHRVPCFIHWPAGGLTGGRDLPSLTAHLDVLPTLVELCGVDLSGERQLDGRSFAAGLKRPGAPPHRDHLIVQFQGGPYFNEEPQPWRFSCVLKDRWRLMDGEELYDLATDPAQRRDVAAEHPEVVAELRAFYPPFWESVSPRMRPVAIDLGNPGQNPTLLCSQDWYLPTGNPPWHFGAINRRVRVTGPWMVDVKRAGRYQIRLRQFPSEAKRPVVAERAKLRIAQQEVETEVASGQEAITFALELPKGRTELETWLYDEEGKAGGAYFTEVEALEVAAKETLPPLKHGEVPGSVEAMWAGFDPRAEPLDVEVLHAWEEEGVVMRVVRFRIGCFKGKVARLAAIYGFPKRGEVHEGEGVPGLLQIHGGGQYANYRACLTNAKRGYATVSIAWAGRIHAPDYRVGPEEVRLFWEGRMEDPRYRLTTDWGALDGYHAPARHPGNQFPSAKPAPWTLDAVESPRNSGWFLCALAARRALTFLEQQPEVDPERLGVYGHSMGGKLTVLTAAADERVKAAAPSCGGISDRESDSALFRATLGDDANLPGVTCPVVFLGPANDFHGHVNDLVSATKEIKATDWRVTCSAHLNHRDYPENEVATQLWFDQHLQGTFRWPETPQTQLQLRTNDGVPSFAVKADASRAIVGVEVYYTQQGRFGKTHRENRIAQFWHHAACEPVGDGTWAAKLPLFSDEAPLWVYANVRYALDGPVQGAGYYYGDYVAKTLNLSSLITLVDAAALGEAGVRPTLAASLLVESFEGDWKKQWFSYAPASWSIRTHKVYHPMWAAPAGAALSLEVLSEQANLLVLGIDGHAAEIELRGGNEWQSLTLRPGDLKDAGGVSLENWNGIKELRLLAEDRLRSRQRGDSTTRKLGGKWKGSAPRFRSLRWTD